MGQSKLSSSMDESDVILEPVNIHRDIHILTLGVILRQSATAIHRTKIYKSFLFSLIPSDLLGCFENFAKEPHQRGTVQIVLTALEHHFELQVPCSCISCSPLFSLKYKVICKEHLTSLLMQILCILFEIYGIKYAKYAIISEEKGCFEWICIQASPKSLDDSIPIWIDGRNDIVVGNQEGLLKFLNQRKKNCIILQFLPRNPPVVCNALWDFTLIAAHKRWLAKFCSIFKAEKKRKIPPKEQQKKEDENSIPSTLAGFTNHPIYVLESKIGKRQALIPEAKSIGKFRDSKIFLRSDLSPLRSREAWVRLGRVVKAEESPFCKQSYTPRVKKLANEDGKATNELYAEWQTEPFQPKVASNGLVPKNSFGNVELFHPSMLPIGCVHLPYPGIQKIAAKLEIDWATAIVGFKFHGGRASPRSLGIVICQEFEQQIMDAYNQFIEALEKAKEKVAQEEEHKKQKINARLEKLIAQFEDSTSQSVVISYEKDTKQINFDSFDAL